MEALTKYRGLNQTLFPSELERQLGKSSKQIKRYFQELNQEFHNIIEVKEKRKIGYQLIDTFDIYIEVFHNLNQLNNLIQISQYERPTLQKKIQYKYETDHNENPYFFIHNTFETIQNVEIFQHLKQAIERFEYRQVKLFNDEKEYEIKPIKLVMVDNNWYIAYIDTKNKLLLKRVTFIEKVSYSKNNTYQKSSIQTALKTLKDNLQNSMTLFEKKPKIAKLKASPRISKYFEKEMKKFLPSQKFIQKNEDRSIEFTLTYTQPLEILPFIQRWMPDLKIIEPEKLKNVYKKRLEDMLEGLRAKST